MSGKLPAALHRPIRGLITCPCEYADDGSGCTLGCIMLVEMSRNSTVILNGERVEELRTEQVLVRDVCRHCMVYPEGSDPPTFVVPEDHADTEPSELARVCWQDQRYGWDEWWYHWQWPCPTVRARRVRITYGG